MTEAKMDKSRRFQISPYWRNHPGKFPLSAKTDKWAEVAALNWGILEAPFSYVPRRQADQEMAEQETGSVLYRTDNYEELSTVTNSFAPVQPLETLAFYRRLADFYNYELVDAGELQDGRVLWAILSTGQCCVLGNGDTVSAHLLLSTHCDKPVAVFVNPLCVLSETHSTFPGSSIPLPPVPLPWSVEFLLPDTLMDLAILEVELHNVTAAMKLMAQQQVTTVIAADYFMAVLAMQSLEESAPRAREQRRQLQAINELHLTNAMDTSAHTLWSLVRTAMTFIDHSRRFSSPHAHQHYAWFGAGRTRKQFALQLAYKLTS
jgi:hypothetical protein